MRRMHQSHKPGPKSNQGFTLIEIVLVLAIAMLLLVVVFLAVSGAQRSRRDFQRKSYLAQVVASLNTYFSVNGYYPNPDTPETIESYEERFLPKQEDPLTGLQYSEDNGNFVYRALSAPHEDRPDVGEVYVQYGHWCNVYGDGDEPGDPIAGNDVNQFEYVTLIGLETGDQYCLDNHDAF